MAEMKIRKSEKNMDYKHQPWNPRFNHFKNGWKWINNHFLCKDLVHHPIDRAGGCLEFQVHVTACSDKKVESSSIVLLNPTLLFHQGQS